MGAIAGGKQDYKVFPSLINVLFNILYGLHMPCTCHTFLRSRASLLFSLGLVHLFGDKRYLSPLLISFLLVLCLGTSQHILDCELQ